MSNKISAAANPALANNILQQVQQEPEKAPYEPTITAPSDTTVSLPGGYLTPDGEVLRTAEVRELNGLDEEALAKAANIGKALLMVVQRGTVSVGSMKATEEVLDELLAGDRDALLLGIIKATFGRTADIPAYCPGCEDFKQVSVDLNEDIKTNALADPLNDRQFIVDCKVGPVVVRLPDGHTQKELILNSEKTNAELKSILLERCVVQINGTPVYSKAQVQRLGLADRTKISDEINSRAPGPQFETLTVTCPDCEGEVRVPINLGTLFRL